MRNQIHTAHIRVAGDCIIPVRYHIDKLGLIHKFDFEDGSFKRVESYLPEIGHMFLREMALQYRRAYNAGVKAERQDQLTENTFVKPLTLEEIVDNTIPAVLQQLTA